MSDVRDAKTLAAENVRLTEELRRAHIVIDQLRFRMDDLTKVSEKYEELPTPQFRALHEMCDVYLSGRWPEGV